MMRFIIILMVTCCVLSVSAIAQERPRAKQNVSFSVVTQKKTETTSTPAKKKVTVGSTDRTAVQVSSSTSKRVPNKKVITVTE